MVLIEQERAVINQRRMYEGNIADLEKALYDKTKEADAAVNSAENREWRITVKRMLEHDIEANSRLSNKLNKAMELVSTLRGKYWRICHGRGEVNLGAPSSYRPTFSRFHAALGGGQSWQNYILTTFSRVRTHLPSQTHTESWICPC